LSALAAALLALPDDPAAADFKVWPPDAEFGETALETRGDWGHSPLAARSGEHSYTEELGRGITPFWCHITARSPRVRALRGPRINSATKQSRRTRLLPRG